MWLFHPTALILRSGHASGAQQIYLRAMDVWMPGSSRNRRKVLSRSSHPTANGWDSSWAKQTQEGPRRWRRGDHPAETTFTGGASWGSQGMIASTFRGGQFSGKCQTREAASALTRLSKGVQGTSWPEFLLAPRPCSFPLLESSFNWANANVASKRSGRVERRELVQSATHPRYAASGQSLCPGRKLDGVPFDHQATWSSGARRFPVVEGSAIQGQRSRSI